MSSTLLTSFANKLLDYIANDTSISGGAGRWLGLATDASLTEVTDGSYARYDLDAAMAAASDATCTNNVAISVNTGAQTATHWFIIDASSGAGTLGKMWYGALDQSITGADSIGIGKIVLDALGA